jgi:hypothetical protein
MSAAQEIAPGALVLRTQHLRRCAGEASVINDVPLEVRHGE